MTYVDAASGERTELSATSLANAAAKIGNALADEFDLDPGARICLGIPAHWQLAAWCAGAWLYGCDVITDMSLAPACDLVVTTSDRAELLAGPCAAAGQTVQVVSTHPFGLPITDALPHGCNDVTLAVRVQPDAYLQSPGARDHRELLAHADSLGHQWGVEPGARVLVPAAIDASLAPLACLAMPLAMDASVVIVAQASTDQIESITAQEAISAWASP